MVNLALLLNTDGYLSVLHVASGVVLTTALKGKHIFCAPVWLSINMAAWRSGAAASAWEAGNIAKRQARGDLLREGAF